jgi:uncharacterized short protein YbdD (DUF466 family)
MPGKRVSGAGPEQPGEGFLGRPCGIVVSALATAIRRISGMPDYKGYTKHLCRYHPGSPVLSEQEYYDEYLRTRYGDGPHRCC